MKPSDRADLQEKLGHVFANPDLMTRALTHASAIPGNARTGSGTYQRLEFLGDRVLGLIIADALVARFPEAPEGELSRVFHRIVSGETCAAVAEELGLEHYVRMGKGPKNSAARATPNVLGDVCEALIGAIYLDGGLEPARHFVERRFVPRIGTIRAGRRDAKTELQEWAHRRGFDTPSYIETLRTGPDHRPAFEIEVVVGDIPPAQGRGGSKREAEHDAAENLLRREGVWKT
jgi:ribonuclease-3